MIGIRNQLNSDSDLWNTHEAQEALRKQLYNATAVPMTSDKLFMDSFITPRPNGCSVRRAMTADRMRAAIMDMAELDRGLVASRLEELLIRHLREHDGEPMD